jgi:hypothetical protein
MLNFRVRYPHEMSCFFGSIRALRKKFHACLTVSQIHDEITRFLTANGMMYNDGETHVDERCGRFSVHDGLVDVGWF